MKIPLDNASSFYSRRIIKTYDPTTHILLALINLCSGTRDEEPLVNAWVNRGWSKVLIGRDGRKLVWADAGRGVLDREVCNRNMTSLGLGSDELLPGLRALANNVSGILLVLAFSSESELVLWLSIRNLVDSEPLIRSPQKTREVSLNILNIIELRCQRIVDINDNDLPVGLLLIKQSHDSEDLDLLDLTRVSNQFTNLADIQWIVVALGLGLGVDDIRVFPSLGESTIVPEITLVREAVADESELALLDVLLDGVEELFLRDLELAVCPSWDLNNHVQDGLLLIGIERDIVEGRDRDAILLDVDAMLESVRCSDLSSLVLGSHCGGGRFNGRSSCCYCCC